MTIIAKNTFAVFLFVAILVCVAGGLFLIGADPDVVALTVVVVGIAMKLDDARIRRARRRN